MISPHTLVNSSLHLYLLLSFLLQSKHNEDVFATRPISLDKPEFEICLLPFFLLFFSSLLPIFPLPYATSCLMSISLSTSSLVMDGLVPFFFFSFAFQDKPEPISVYHPMAKEISASIGTPMEGFFEGANVMFKATTPAPPATTQGVPAEAHIPSIKPIPIGKGTYTERVSETTLTPIETLTPQEGVIPSAIAQTEVASPATLLVIFTSDPFVALSQAVKDGSSLVVTPSSIPSSATRGLDADLSFEESEEVLEDPDDKPTMKKKVFDSEDEEGAEHEAEFMGMCLLILLSSLLPFFFVISSLCIYICVTPSLQSPFILHVHSSDCKDL